MQDQDSPVRLYTVRAAREDASEEAERYPGAAVLAARNKTHQKTCEECVAVWGQEACVVPIDYGKYSQEEGSIRDPQDLDTVLWVSRDHAGVRQPLALGSTVGQVDTWPQFSSTKDLTKGLTIVLQYRDAQGRYVASANETEQSRATLQLWELLHESAYRDLSGPQERARLKVDDERCLATGPFEDPSFATRHWRAVADSFKEVIIFREAIPEKAKGYSFVHDQLPSWIRYLPRDKALVSETDGDWLEEQAWKYLIDNKDSPGNDTGSGAAEEEGGVWIEPDEEDQTDKDLQGP